MIDERERCLEILGLKPGAAAQEIKAAYRDLAKVWHPDRFAHDPRLQEKAQDKLKEINEAYEALTSNSFNRSPRPARPSTTSTATHAPEPRAQHNGSKYQWAAIALVLCVVTAGFFIAPRLLKRDNGETGQASVTSEPARNEESAKDDAASKLDESALNRKEKKGVEKPKTPAEALSDTTSEPHAPPRALPTVTVTIDPTTGQLATAACPIKTSMTYVAGQEPHQYCSANHQTAARTEAKEAQPSGEKKSRLKTLVNGLSAPARWLKNKSKQSADEN
jgi:curved DNA-binding protein CbpA